MTAEKAGTFVNYAGRLQRVEPAVGPPGEAEADGHVLCLIGEKLDQPLCDSSAAAVFARMADSVDAFKGIQWDSIGATGVQLNGMPADIPRVSKLSPAPQLDDSRVSGAPA
jgi:predicted molibdopterin-dependent oxidoreductase YjgC